MSTLEDGRKAAMIFAGYRWLGSEYRDEANRLVGYVQCTGDAWGSHVWAITPYTHAVKSINTPGWPAVGASPYRAVAMRRVEQFVAKRFNSKSWFARCPK
jgi:hypothetical protein